MHDKDNMRCTACGAETPYSLEGLSRVDWALCDECLAKAKAERVPHSRRGAWARARYPALWVPRPGQGKTQEQLEDSCWILGVCAVGLSATVVLALAYYATAQLWRWLAN